MGCLEKSHSIESKNKMSLSQSGERNRQFGTMWITNGTENKKIKKITLFQKVGKKVEK
jgi:hypothetical protein